MEVWGALPALAPGFSGQADVSLVGHMVDEVRQASPADFQNDLCQAAFPMVTLGETTFYKYKLTLAIRI